VTRLVAVLGYSSRRGGELHPICAARLETAQRVAAEGDVVLFSGWSRREGRGSEAELMAAAWAGADVRVETDTGSRHTVQNAARVTALAERLGADEVVVVTSWWHRPRAAAIVRAAFAGSRVRPRTLGAPSPWSLRLVLRELAYGAALPLQLVEVRRSRRLSA
jgi:uncharacterized SAM-binding protein YcdF (DUF218 family)